MGVPADYSTTADLLGSSASGSSDARRLQAWWLYRMCFTPEPLLERLTLMWHDHFATSMLKVDDVAAMHAQNELFRQLRVVRSETCCATMLPTRPCSSGLTLHRTGKDGRTRTWLGS